MSRWLKMALLAAPLLVAGYWFGLMCERIGQAYELLLSPSRELLILVLWVLLALGAVVVSAGVVAALLRPTWVAALAFTLSGLAMVLGWRVTAASAGLTLVYVLAGVQFCAHTAREMSQRIRFSVQPIGQGQGLLRAALVLLACGGLYLGCASHVQQEGFRVPQKYIDMLAEQMGKQVTARAPEEQRQQVMAEFKKEFQRTMDAFLRDAMKRYQRFVPWALAFVPFTSLLGITNLLAWVPTLVLRLVFPLLTTLGITKVIAEIQEVQRLVVS